MRTIRVEIDNYDGERLLSARVMEGPAVLFSATFPPSELSEVFRITERITRSLFHFVRPPQ